MAGTGGVAAKIEGRNPSPPAKAKSIDKDALVAYVAQFLPMCPPGAQVSVADPVDMRGTWARATVHFVMSEDMAQTGQYFAELNAANPIFVEDAARSFCAELLKDVRIRDFRVVASHQESLHSHDAVSVLTEGETFANESLDPRLFQSLFHVG